MDKERRLGARTWRRGEMLRNETLVKGMRMTLLRNMRKWFSINIRGRRN